MQREIMRLSINSSRKTKKSLEAYQKKLPNRLTRLGKLTEKKSALTQEKETTSLEIEFAAQIKVQKTTEIETLSKLINDNSANKYESDSIL